ncbi:MAG TPA: protein kinase [Gallionellaceae bacterium]
MGQLGRYEILEELGRGSMGIVYKANDPLIGRQVAIKAINLHGLDPKKREEYEARFYLEAKAAGSLNHPNIVTIHDLGESGDTAYIAMELLEGRELHNDVDEMERMPFEKVLNIAIQVTDGLAFAHEHGIVHRDIKPSNIMLLNDSHVKIADFGIAKMDTSLMLTRTGMIMGSPLYMSPEQVLSSSIDARSDIFSFGIVLYQLLTGRRPFSGDDANSVMYQIVNEAPHKPSSLNSKLPEMMDNIVLKCLAKKPQDRYQNAKDLGDDLRACLQKLTDEKTALEHPVMFSMEWRRVKRLAIPGAMSQTMVAITALAAIMLIVLLDALTDETIQVHLLYIFPLVLVSFHSQEMRLVYTTVILSLLFQGVSIVGYSGLPPFSQFVLAMLVLLSNVLIAYVARIARTNFLEVGHLATFDGLTGLRNRLSFESLVEMEIARQKRNGGTFSFAFIDIDNLRELNSAMGFQTGDDAIKLLANILRDHIRQTDTVARLGGDEFAILMPNTEALGCQQFCTELSVKISTLMKKAALPISTSIGYVTVDHPPGSISEVFNRAESAMHVAQSGGKGGATRG